MALPRRAPDLAGLDLLVAIADEGGVAAAARVLGVSQPTASERLNALERRLGLRLVHRGRSGSTLTGEGAALVDLARPVLRLTHELVAAAETLRGENSSRLVVSASLTVAEHLVPRWLVVLSEQGFDVSVSVRMGNSRDVAEQVRAGSAHIGFVEGPSAPAGLRSRTVCTDELVLVVAPEHPWARRRQPVGPAALADTGLVMRESGSGTREVLEQWMTATGHRPVAAVELASTTAMVKAVLAGVGPGVVSGLAVRSELADGRLVRVPLAGPPEPAPRRDRPTARRRVHLDRRIRAVWRGPGTPTAAASQLLGVALRTS
jgi:molybdate transport repressor ModE-like protein